VPGASATVRVRVSGAGVDAERSADLGALETLVEVGGLPIGDPLEVEVAALDAAEETVTSWSGTVTLQEGSNPLAISLSPASGSITQLSVSDTSPALALGTGSLGPSEAAFYEVTFLGAAREWQLIADTGTARWLWLQAYDADWRPLDAIASDAGQGWTVVSAGGGAVVRFAVANTVASPGYPSSLSASYTLQARPAYFASTGGGGGGTSGAPTSMGGSIELPGISIFMRAGDYSGSPVVIREDVHVYGGFSAASWAVRDPAVHETWLSKSAPSGTATVVVGDDGAPAKGRLDGVIVVADPIEDGNQTTVAVNVKNLAAGTRYVITNSVILGSRVGITSGAYSVTGLYLGSTAGMTEASGNLIRGAASAVQGSINVTSQAISIAQGAVYIHDNDIDGGSVRTGSSSAAAAGVYANGISTISVVVAGNRIWGGRVEAGNPDSSATGIYVNGPAGATTPTIIANNVVSGGYSAMAGGALITGIGIEDPSGETYVVGNTVDGGSAVASSTAVLSGIKTIYSNMETDAVANAVFVSNGAGASGATKAAFEAAFDTAYFRSLIGNTAVNLPAPYIPNFGGTPAAFSAIPVNTTSSGNEVYAGAPGSAFRSYRADSYDADTWFADNDLAFASSASPGARVATGAYIGAAKIAEFPALGLDAAGASRPAGGLWYRGAFEP
jgi:hypothetical protein